MARKMQSGDRVIIEIRDLEVYEGTIDYISARSIELCNIFCHTKSTQYDGSMTFYCNEVVKISRITDSPDSDGSPSVDGSFDLSKKITMDPDEFQRLKQMTFDFIFVDTFGKRFDDAVEVLSNRESVAVVGLGNTFIRGKSLSLLLMADFKQVYIFDLFCLVELKKLKNILESSYICKVVHGGTALYDCLYHKYKVDMKNVFDTKVVDTMISTQENKESVSRSISECLTHHFNFPPSLLSAAMDDIADKAWVERPIIKSNKIKASQLVSYLLTLRDRLMSQILKTYSSTIEKEYSKFKTIADSELLKFKPV